MIHLENVLKISLQDVLKMSWRRFCKTSWRRLEDVLKTCWQDVLKPSWRRMTKTNILVLVKTSSEDVCVRWIYSSWSRRRLISIDIEAIRTVFNLIFFSWRNFKHLKHKQKIIFNLNNIQSNIFINKKGIQVTFN